MTFTAARLIGQDLRCASGISAEKATSGFAPSSVDTVDGFCLAGCPVPPAPPVPAAPAIRASGGALAWNKIGDITSYVVSTSSAPEGTKGRTTTYTTVTGTSYTPPTAPGTTRYYGVRANATGALWASPEVGIAYPVTAGAPGQGPTPVPVPKPTPSPQPVVAPSPVASPQPAPPTAGGKVVAGATQPSVLPAQPTAAAALSLSVPRAKSVAQKALRSRFSTSFARRTRRSFQVTCTSTSAVKAVCKVRWRYKRFSYKGQVTVTRTPAGDRWRTRIARTARTS